MFELVLSTKKSKMYRTPFLNNWTYSKLPVCSSWIISPIFTIFSKGTFNQWFNAAAILILNCLPGILMMCWYGSITSWKIKFGSWYATKLVEIETYFMQLSVVFFVWNIFKYLINWSGHFLNLISNKRKKWAFHERFLMKLTIKVYYIGCMNMLCIFIATWCFLKL